MNALIIDCDTSTGDNKGHKEILEYLDSLDSTISIIDGGEYRYCPDKAQLGIFTELTADEVENKLWENNYDYVGVVDDDDNRYGFIDKD